MKINRYVIKVKRISTVRSSKIGEPVILDETDAAYIIGFVSNKFEKTKAIEICLFEEEAMEVSKKDAEKRFLYFEENYESTKRFEQILEENPEVAEMW